MLMMTKMCSLWSFLRRHLYNLHFSVFFILQGVPSSTETDDHGLPTNFESGDIHIAGLVVSSYSWEHSHWAARQSLSQWLVDKQVPGIYGIDTRALTKKIREFGALLGNIVVVSCCY